MVTRRRATTVREASRNTPDGAEPTSADVVDQQLAKYRSMRDFHITAEPAGAVKDGTRKGLPFCIQKHAASHLHYDFRLGWNGVLKSWACAKGPSYVVADRRLAVEVEDHPIEYGGFEGIIPKGQYGGGTVMLWDQGTWEPQPGHTDVDAGLRAGQLKFIMHGEKIKGKWALIRMGGRAATERKPNWLLIKEHDEFERPVGAPSVTEAEDRSVATRRTMEEIARQEDHVWNSKETAGTGQAWYRQNSSASEGAGQAADGATAADGTTANGIGRPARAGVAGTKTLDQMIDDLPEEPQPSFVKPQLATEAMAAPEGAGWLYELKLDGYRMQARKNGASVEMLTRSGLDWTYRVPAVAEAVARLPVRAATLDGEVVVLREDGTTNFADLQASFQEGAHNPLTFFCFDLLHVEGRNPRGMELRERKKMLAEVVAGSDGDQVRMSEDIEGRGEEIFKRACELHAEGVIAKRAAAAYVAGRTNDWQKLKCLLEQEFVVGGYTVSSDGQDRVGSLLLGYYRDGKLVYAGRTGTGFTQKMRRLLMERLGPMRLARMAYAAVPAEGRKDAVWVRPDLVAQVRFATWTADDVVRQAAFLGLREDKAAKEVRREEATVAPKPKAERGPVAVEAVSAGKAVAPEKFHVRGRAPKSAKEEEAAAKVVDARIRSVAGAPAVGKGAAAAKVAEMEHAPVRLTHPAKVLDVESGVTKQMLADFYWAVAERMLPHIRNRPLSLVRCPDGSTKPCFYQKHVNHMLPKGITGVPVPDKKTGVPEEYITLDSAEALAGLSQMGVLEVHPWGSCNADLEHANRLVFDLDPDEALGWGQVAASAEEMRARLKKIGLESFLKTTGGKGLHLVVPVEPTLDWNAVKEFARQFVVSLERANPRLYLTKMSKAARVGKIYLDYLRNERGATAVAPYSPRARAGMPVSVPLAWSELKTGERPKFAVANFGEWRAQLKKDPWKGMEGMRQRIEPERLRVQ